jgi:hypothetical protein
VQTQAKEKPDQGLVLSHLGRKSLEGGEFIIASMPGGAGLHRIQTVQLWSCTHTLRTLQLWRCTHTLSDISSCGATHTHNQIFYSGGAAHTQIPSAVKLHTLRNLKLSNNSNKFTVGFEPVIPR